MNINLITVDGGTTWRRGGMPRVTRCKLGATPQIPGNTDVTVFSYVIPAGDPWIGQKVMIRPYLSLDDLAWGPQTSGYFSVIGPIRHVDNTNSRIGCRTTHMEWTASGTFPNGGPRRRSHATAMLDGFLSGAGTLSIRFKVALNSSLRNNDLEQNVCLMMLLGL